MGNYPLTCPDSIYEVLDTALNFVMDGSANYVVVIGFVAGNNLLSVKLRIESCG